MGEGRITGVNGVLIWTANFGPMLEFYRDTLGLEPRSVKDDFVNFEWGGLRLSVSVHSEVEGLSRDPLRIMINFAVDNIRETYERLAANGVSFSRVPSQEQWGGWVATFHDPDGNTLQLLQP
jgi:catechol 2,3-dioxygenase-like lactoylglutathione lyase family enzyme